MSLYQALVDAKCEIDNHESDLYVKATPEVEKIIRQHACNASRFVSQIDGSLWWDVPFAYEPFWEAKAKLV